MHVDPGHSLIAATQVPCQGGTVMPVLGTRVHGRRRVCHGWPGDVASDFDVLKACEIGRRGLCWGSGANH